MIEYQAVYRRGEFAIPALIMVMLFLAGGIFIAIRTVSSNALLTAILEILGAAVIAILVIFASAFRIHRWTIVEGGMRVTERPRVPLMGLRRSAQLRWDQIAALRRVESGLDHQLELVGPSGRRFRIAQAMKAGLGVDPTVSLDDFLSAIRAAAKTAGAVVPEVGEGLSFWNTIPGLFFQTIMLAITALFAAGTGRALLGGGIAYFPRVGYFTAIALLLPIGAAWLLIASLRRRRLVLASRRSGG